MVINRQAAFTLLENSYLREKLQQLSQERDSLMQDLAQAQEELNLINSDSYIVAHRRSMEY